MASSSGQVKSNSQLNLHMGRRNSNTKNTKNPSSSTPAALAASTLNSFHAIYGQPSPQQLLFNHQQQQQQQLLQQQQQQGFHAKQQLFSSDPQVVNNRNSAARIESNGTSANSPEGTTVTAQTQVVFRHIPKQNSVSSGIGITQGNDFTNTKSTTTKKLSHVLNIETLGNTLNANQSQSQSTTAAEFNKQLLKNGQPKLLGQSPSKTTKTKSSHFNLGASFQSHRNPFPSSSTPTHSQYNNNNTNQFPAQPSNPSNNFNNYTSNIPSILQQTSSQSTAPQQQLLPQPAAKAIFSPMKTFFKSSTNNNNNQNNTNNTLDSTNALNTHMQQSALPLQQQASINGLLNKTNPVMHFNTNSSSVNGNNLNGFQAPNNNNPLAMHSSSTSSTALHQTLQLPQQMHSQSTKNVFSTAKDNTKGPFFFPSMAKKPPILANSNSTVNNNNSTASSNQNTQVQGRKGSAKELFLNTNNINSNNTNHPPNSNSNSNINNSTNIPEHLHSLKSERDVFLARIDKLEQEKEDFLAVAYRQTALKEAAMQCIKSIAEMSHRTFTSNATSNNPGYQPDSNEEILRIVQESQGILQLENELQQEFQWMLQFFQNASTSPSDSLSSPKTSSGYSILELKRKNSSEKHSEDTILNNSKQNSFRISLKRSSLPNSPKRKQQALERPVFFPLSPSQQELLSQLPMYPEQAQFQQKQPLPQLNTSTTAKQGTQKQSVSAQQQQQQRLSAGQLAKNINLSAVTANSSGGGQSISNGALRNNNNNNNNSNNNSIANNISTAPTKKHQSVLDDSAKNNSSQYMGQTSMLQIGNTTNRLFDQLQLIKQRVASLLAKKAHPSAIHSNNCFVYQEDQSSAGYSQEQLEGYEKITFKEGEGQQQQQQQKPVEAQQQQQQMQRLDQRNNKSMQLPRKSEGLFDIIPKQQQMQQQSDELTLKSYR